MAGGSPEDHCSEQAPEERSRHRSDSQKPHTHTVHPREYHYTRFPGRCKRAYSQPSRNGKSLSPAPQLHRVVVPVSAASLGWLKGRPTAWQGAQHQRQVDVAHQIMSSFVAETRDTEVCRGRTDPATTSSFATDGSRQISRRPLGADIWRVSVIVGDKATAWELVPDIAGASVLSGDRLTYCLANDRNRWALVQPPS